MENNLYPPESKAAMQQIIDESLDWRKIALKIHNHFFSNETNNIPFLTLALSGEAGELANLVKKEWRDKTLEHRRNMAKELADVRIYTEILAHELGIDLDLECSKKLAEKKKLWGI